MTTYICVPGRATAFGSRKTGLTLSRHYTSAAGVIASKEINAVSNGNATRPTKDPLAQRELFMNVLNANATKRDAKQYLARFKSPKPSSLKPTGLSAIQEERNARHRLDQDRLDRMGVNLGGLYAPARAIADSPQFVQQRARQGSMTGDDVMHVALVCLKSPEDLDDATLEGLALTLSQLVKLDMRIVMVIELSSRSKDGLLGVEEIKRAVAAQAERLCQAIWRHSPEGARYLSGALEIDETMSGTTSTLLPKLIEEPLERGLVTVLPTLAYTSSGQLAEARLENVMTGLTRELAGVRKSQGHGERDCQAAMLLDRIIVLDALGGVPSKERGDGAHVFINLEQEFHNIIAELMDYATAAINGSAVTFKEHQANLQMLQRCLALLPSSSSALIISPQEAASSSQSNAMDESFLGAGTRRQKNTLIHNLLTNKPMVSPSLPAARLSSSQTDGVEAVSMDAPTATLVKRGMPLSIVPAVDRRTGWQSPASGCTSLSLEDDPRVDFGRLVHLIDDSFRRKLDVQHYLNRVRGRLAGLIVAGEYEGGAILTWEQPPGTTDPKRLVPYLDKFAVLQSSQGSSGVADILFQAMVRSCFPHGVCWRSRKDNPVNKWYFERAVSSWEIHGTQWTMFWTGEGVESDEIKFQDYVSVCRSVVPSWADGKRPD